MSIFAVILILAIGGIGFVVWNLLNEKKTERIFEEMERQGKVTPITSFNQFDKDTPNFSTPTPESEEPESGPKIGTASMKTRQSSASPANPSPQKFSSLLSKTDEKEIKKEIDLSFQHSELKEKFEKLERLFQEKSEALNRDQKALENEQKNRKEFNKVKDILEKEIKDLKDKLREALTEADSTKAESDHQQKRLGQLEEKTIKLEKEILAKEQVAPTLASAPAPALAPKPLPAQPPAPEPPLIPESSETAVSTESTNSFLTLQPDVLSEPQQNPEPKQEKPQE